MLHKHPHRIMSIPHRRGIDVYCFASRYIALEARRTQAVAVCATALLQHVWMVRRAMIVFIAQPPFDGGLPQEDSHGWFTQARTGRL
jgi:hypothetical protein